VVRCRRGRSCRFEAPAGGVHPARDAAGDAARQGVVDGADRRSGLDPAALPVRLMRDVMELYVIDTESVTVRSVAGHGDQAELTVQTRRGRLTLRLLAREGRTVRLTDLRARDKRRRRRGP